MVETQHAEDELWTSNVVFLSIYQQLLQMTSPTKPLCENSPNFTNINFGWSSFTFKETYFYIYRWLLGLTVYLIEMPFNAFANRADPDQAALVIL